MEAMSELEKVQESANHAHMQDWNAEES